MTFADETANALYATVCERPECDTARLILADRLDEIGDRDRAEYIRNSVAGAMKTIPPGWFKLAMQPMGDSPWRKCPCPACEGSGYQGLYADSSDPPCQACGGTGDLFARKRWQQEGGGAVQVTGSLLVTFARGFPDSVECTAADVWREGIGTSTSGGTAVPVTVPTEWAKAVTRVAPVTRFVLTDSVPAESARHGGWWRWYAGEARDEVPQVVFDLLVGEYPSDWRGAALVPYWRSEAAARDALAVALGKWVRAAAYPAAPGG